ncbi:FAD-dependent monooxygenase [Nocardiopsis tropica]|uniref:FAD-dependent monooxygenase n=1 Tax=Nocardiopsis tropica TaxID=109330 RepID=UPI0031D7FE5A
MRTPPAVLVSGAGVAGPVLAHQLVRLGFAPVVVERAPAPHAGPGGFGVDLFGPGVEVMERLGVLDRVREAATGNTRMRLVRPGGRPLDLDLGALAQEASTDRHVEVMRGDLASILYAATRDDVEYVFGDSVEGVAQTPHGLEVSFERGAPRVFDLMAGADGLHSATRRLVFGPEERYRRFLGGHVAVFGLPEPRGFDGRVVLYRSAGRTAAVFPVRGTGRARGALLFRGEQEFAGDHRDTEAQRRFLRAAFAGEGWEVPRLLDAADSAEDLYFDSISQIRMESWTRGRVALVGDAGYAPGPAVGGGTTVAAVGAYTLAHRLGRASGDHLAAFPGYEEDIGGYVRRSREVGPRSLRTLVPGSRWEAALGFGAMWLLPRLPRTLLRAAANADSRAARVLSSVDLPEPAPRPRPSR